MPNNWAANNGGLSGRFFLTVDPTNSQIVYAAKNSGNEPERRMWLELPALVRQRRRRVPNLQRA